MFNSKSGGFRLYNQYCVFVYTHLQKILQDSHLGPISDWDAYMSTNMDDPTLPFKSVDDVLLDHDLSDLLKTSKISTPRRFVSQIISFYKYFIKLLVTNDIATSAFVRGLSAFDEPIARVGRKADYTEAIQLLSGYFVQQKWIASSVKPVKANKYCSLATKLRSDKLPAAKDWVETFSCHFKLLSRAELFDLFKVCCEALCGPCSVPPPFTVSIPGLRSDAFEFSSCVRSLQCSLASIQKCESLFLSPTALPRAFELVERGPGLILIRNISVWNLLSSTHFLKPGLLASLEGYYTKSGSVEAKGWIATDDRSTFSPRYVSSTGSTPVKTVAERKIDSTPVVSPVVQRLTEVPVIPDRMVSGSKQMKKSSASVL